MYLIEPQPPKRKWDVRLRNHDGRIVKVSGDRDRTLALRIGERVEMLVRAKLNGDPPPGELKAWIDGMGNVLAKRLVTLGLLSQRRIDRMKPLTEQVDEFEKVVAARKNNSARHAGRQASILKRLFKLMKVTSFSEVNEDAVSLAVKGMNKAVATRRHYIVAVRDFAKWMTSTGRAASNPVVGLKPPSMYADPTIERVPLTVAQFLALTTYLDTFERYEDQVAGWSTKDRKLLYWTAVRTAFRQAELRSLRVQSLLLDANPPQVAIRAGDAKNSTKAFVPIPRDLAAACREYIKDRDPEERLFPMPTASHSVLDIFRRDLSGAGIRWNWGEGDPQRIDFHTLRTTAITWWLDVDGLPPKRVQILARLKSLHLVALYSRNLRLDEFAWLDAGPTLVVKPDPQPIGVADGKTS